MTILENNKEKLGYFLIILGFLFLLLMVYISFSHVGIWYDETFSLWTVGYNLPYILNFIQSDVHPPLFYLLFYFAVQLCSLFNYTNLVVIGKVLSLIPLFLTFILGMTKVKKNFGTLTAGLFCFMIVTMPQIMCFAIQIRMYSWAFFFITASVIYAYQILKDESNYKNWIILTILSILSSYTHYFSLITSVFIYCFLFIYLIFNNKKKIKEWLISSIFIILAYVPWISVFLHQQAVHSEYWLKGITLMKAIGFIFFALSPQNEIILDNRIVSFDILGLLLLIVILILIFYSIKDNLKSLDIKYGISCILLIVCVVLSGIIISIIVTPYFHVRYMVPALGSLWLGVSILLAKSYDKKYLFVPILIIILVCSCVESFTFYEDQLYFENADHAELEKLTDFVGNDNIGNDTVFILDYFASYMLFKYHFTDSENYLINFTDNPINDVGTSSDTLTSEISKILANDHLEGKTIYFVQSKDYGDLPLVTENYTLTKINTLKNFPYSPIETIIYQVTVK